MKKIVKIVSGIAAFALIGILLWTANGFVGNPISKSMANKSAKEFIHENYEELNLEVKEAEYSFKDGKYLVHVTSPTSMDTYFTVMVLPNGEVFRTTFEDQFLSKFNTWHRVNEEYSMMVKSVMKQKDFPYESEIGFGQIPIMNVEDETFGPQFGVDLEDLEIDEKYDVKALASDVGHMVFYISDDEVNAKRAAEILMDLKNILDENEVSFYALDFTLEEPKDEDTDRLNLKTFSVRNFRYDDIHQDNLPKRLEKSAEELKKFYDDMDEKK